MTNVRVAQAPSADTAFSSGRNPSAERERMREIIHAEVAKLNPTDDARRALELIIEASVRPSQGKDGLMLTVVDQTGQPRTILKNGETAEFTIRDLLEELRASHPILFRSPAAETRESVAAEAPREPDPPRRDWLDVGSAQAPEGPTPEFVDNSAFSGLREGTARLQGWSRAALAAWKSGAKRYAVKLQAARDGYSLTSEGGTSDDRPTPLPLPAQGQRRVPVYAIGAAALALLLGIGAVAWFTDDDAPTVQAGVEEPLSTGTVTSAQAANDAPPPPASSGGPTLRGVPDVIDTATLSLQGEVVRLFGVEWAPGGGKPEELTRYLQGREVVCNPAGPNETYRCLVGGQDLSRVVLFNGGGQPTPEATPELKAAADKAREAKLGVWNKTP